MKLPNFQEFEFSAWKTWFSKFKAASLIQRYDIATGVVFDFGSNQTKTARWDNTTKKIELKVCPSVYEITDRNKVINPYTIVDPSTLKMGTGTTPIPRHDPKDADVDTLRLIIGCLSPYTHAFEHSPVVLLEPGEPFPLPGSLSHFLVCESSVAALCAFQRGSGVVVSLGAAKAWIEVIINYKPKWHCFLPRITTDCKQELDMLVSNFDTWIQARNRFSKLDPPFEFCCIGAPFDEKAIDIFKKILNSKKIEFSIISTVNERIFAPVLGALVAPFRNPLTLAWQDDSQYWQRTGSHLLFSGIPRYFGSLSTYTPQFKTPWKTWALQHYPNRQPQPVWGAPAQQNYNYPVPDLK